MPRQQRSNPRTKHYAIQLRAPALAGGAREESTPAESKHWSRLRNDQLGVTFRRQHAIGHYIPDFCSPKAKLIIELDGSQHLDQREYDEERTRYFELMGYKVLRFWNNAVMNDIESVIRAIIQAEAISNIMCKCHAEERSDEASQITEQFPITRRFFAPSGRSE